MASLGNEQAVAAGNYPDAAGWTVVLVKTEWNAAIVDELAAGTEKVLRQAGVQRIETIVVPGAVEIPFAVASHARNHYLADAYIALGCVIKGDTPHFEYVCQSVTQSITQLNITLEAPVIFGVLTVNTEAQAFERIGGIHGHKGEEAAVAALKMIALNK
jgi:6,7-dimethyl-8-ribityllumazine synthase